MILLRPSEHNYLRLRVRGVHPPRGHDAFPSLFQICPLFPRNCSGSVENVHGFTFSEKKFRFSSAKISDDLLLVIDHRFEMSPLFSFFQPNSSSCFDQIFHSPNFAKFPPLIGKNYCALYMLSVIFVSPYFYHDAFMHHTMHVLDALLRVDGPISLSKDEERRRL